MNLETKQIDRLNYFRSGLWIISVLCLIISSLGISFCSRSSDFYDARINYYDQLGNLLSKNDTIDEEIDSYYQGNLEILPKKKGFMHIFKILVVECSRPVLSVDPDFSHLVLELILVGPMRLCFISCMVKGLICNRGQLIKET